MAAKFLDTNIFLEIFVRSGEKSDRSRKLVESEGELSTSSLVVSEIEWVLRSAYKAEKEIIVRCLKKVLSSDIAVDNRKILINALHFYETNNVDWTDCVNIFLLKDAGGEEIYSYDRGLGKFPGIKRREP
jgi:predicted nucleic acid-binding protein